MVYEIYFEPKGAVWQIRITVFYLYFFAVSRVIQNRKTDEPLLEPMSFSTFEEAERYAVRVGLDKAYQRRCRGVEYRSQLHGALAHGTASS